MLSRRVAHNGVVFYASPLLERAGMPHAFSTRIGGVSDGPFASLNLGNPSNVSIQDNGDNIAENYRRLHEAIECEDRHRCYVHQVHGAESLNAARGESFTNGACGDAIVSDDPSRLLAIRVADCVPVLLATRDGQRVAAVHAGWRGIVAGVVTNAAAQLESKDLIGAIGPCLSVAHFEVGEEVLAEFRRVFGDRAPIQGRFIDLREAVRLQCIDAGISADRIDMTDRCTFRDRDEFFSHRRDAGITGRMAAVIGARRQAGA
jgi:YfiH family protein